MKKSFYFTAVVLLAMFSCQLLKAQQLQYPVSVATTAGVNNYGHPGPAIRAWTDPALNHNRLIQNQNGDGKVKLIGPYKVKGSSELYGEYHKADLFAPEVKAYNIYISYNTYNQEVEFYSTSNPNQPLIREPGTLDSFVILEDSSIGIAKSLKFIYGSHLDAKEKSYFLELYSGKRFSLYKRYKSDLGYVSSNIGETELRQFDLLYDYFYVDHEKKGIKKLKANPSVIVNEFKKAKDLSAVIDNEAFSLNQEYSMLKAFEALNN
jgi:hypothetical protein